MLKIISTSCLFVALSMAAFFGCGGDGSTVIPVKVPQGSNANVATLVVTSSQVTGNVQGTSTLVANNTIPSTAPAQLDQSSLPGTRWAANFNVFLSNSVGLGLIISKNQIEVSVVCVLDGGAGGIFSNTTFAFPVSLDGNVIYLQNNFDIKTQDAASNFCELELTGNYIKFSASSGTAQVLLGNIVYTFTQF